MPEHLVPIVSRVESPGRFPHKAMVVRVPAPRWCPPVCPALPCLARPPARPPFTHIVPCGPFRSLTSRRPGSGHAERPCRFSGGRRREGSLRESRTHAARAAGRRRQRVGRLRLSHPIGSGCGAMLTHASAGTHPACGESVCAVVEWEEEFYCQLQLRCALCIPGPAAGPEATCVAPKYVSR